MIGMSEYYIVLNKCEVGPSVENLLYVYRQTGSVDLIGTDAYRIQNASQLDQQSTFEAFERAIDADMGAFVWPQIKSRVVSLINKPVS